jgi:hypothetical protein
MFLSLTLPNPLREPKPRKKKAHDNIDKQLLLCGWLMKGKMKEITVPTLTSPFAKTKSKQAWS